MPTLYFSADSDAFTQLTRMLSVLMEWTTEDSAYAVLEDDLAEAKERLENLPIRFHYDASPSLSDIEEVVEAYFEVYDVYPSLIVVDNVTNVRTSDEDDDPFSGLEPLMEYLHDMARQTGACVVGLHHVKGEYNDSDKPIPLSGIKGQISRVPELIITLFRQAVEFGFDKLLVSCVKNRNGKMDASGMTYAELVFDGSRMQIRDF